MTDLGRIQLEEGDAGQAAQTLAQAIEAGAGLSAMWLLGNALEEAGQGQSALETYLRIGYLYPLNQKESAQAMLRAGILLEADGRVEQARKVLEKVRDNGPDPWQKEAELRLKAAQTQ